MKSVAIYVTVLLACAGHARGACAAVRAIAAGVSPEEAVKLTGAQIDAVAPPKAPDGTYVAGMSDVKAAALDHPFVQDLRLGFMTDKYESDPTAQHMFLVVPTDAALAKVGIASAADFGKTYTPLPTIVTDSPMLPVIVATTIFDAHELNTKPRGPVMLSLIIKGRANHRDDDYLYTGVQQPVTLAKADSETTGGATIRELITQAPESIALTGPEGNPSVTPPALGFACSNGMNVLVVGDPQILAEAASQLLEPAAGPNPAPSPTPPSAAASLRVGAAALAAAALATLF